MTNEEKYLTAAEVADIFGVSVFTIHRYAKAGEFPEAFRIPGRGGWRIPESDVRAFAARRAAATIVEGAAAQAAATA